MQNIPTLFVGAALVLAAQAASAGPVADRVSGSPKANFSTNELTIPCVRVESFSSATEGKFYDIVLKRRGNSMNYELIAADAEDPVQCQRIADFSEFEEDTDEPALLAQCAVTATRSIVAVQSKELEDGSYYAVATSGDQGVESDVADASDGMVSFDFDSEATAIADGAEAVDADFIVDNEVSVELFAEDDDEPMLTVTATCLG
ncbi:MAG: hypothetical protein RLZZ227_2016 [Pseudomonadota bacterium]